MSGTSEIVQKVEPHPFGSIPAPKPDLRSPLNFSKRIPELDGLRGLAMAMVVYMHYIWFPIVSTSPKILQYILSPTRPLVSAVDLFFILSGLLIGGNLLDARDSPHYFKTFYIRRFSRVLPIYFLFLGLVGIAYRFLYLRVGAPLDWVFANSYPWYAYLSFAQNLWMAKYNWRGSLILSITWAFAVEVQFYLFVPGIIRFVRRSSLPFVFAAGIASAPLARLFLAHQYPDNLGSTYFLLPCHLDSLFLGLLLAYYLRQPAAWNWLVKSRRAMWILLLSLVAGISLMNAPDIPLTKLWLAVGYGWVSAFYASLVILALTDPQSLLGRMMRWHRLTDLGTTSYGVYLFHLGILGICAWLLNGHGLILEWRDLGIAFLSLAITMVLAKVSWLYFEKPIVRWSHRFRY
jgi:peptidoglycan/LPS O-acetylase OafA/YrhL